MNKYEKGKIYKIVNDDIPDKVYYGSTIGKLNIRFSNHNNSYNTCSSKILFEKGQPRIELVEEYPCSSKRELLVRERFYIENNECVNIKIPSRTHGEYHRIWYTENKEKVLNRVKEYSKIHREDKKLYATNYYHKNIEIIKKKREEKIQCECGFISVKSNLKRHKKSKKHLEFENKIDI